MFQLIKVAKAIHLIKLRINEAATIFFPFLFIIEYRIKKIM